VSDDTLPRKSPHASDELLRLPRPDWIYATFVYHVRDIHGVTLISQVAIPLFTSN
jgi:hypothetical protein